MALLLNLSYALLAAVSIGAHFVLIPVHVNLTLTSMLIIYIGSHRALDSKETETLSTKDAYMFPVMGSIALFSLYIAFKYFDKYYVNFLIGLYFGFICCIVLAQAVSPLFAMVLPKKQVCNAKCSFPKFLHWLLGDKFHLELSLADVVAGLISAVISVWHFQSRHYLSNNLFGVALSIQAIELMALGSYAAGAIMLVGLFLYDIFWVFGTEVMVTVATSFDAPIKLLFKRTHATVDTDAQFSLLGLGDIVIPGIFIAMLLQYDAFRTASKQASTSSFSKPFFSVTLVFYVLGLLTTLFVMYTFHAAQPALLYLSPACLLASMGVGVVTGEFMRLVKFAKEEEKGESKDKEEKLGDGDGSGSDKDTSGAEASNDNDDDDDGGLRQRRAVTAASS